MKNNNLKRKIFGVIAIAVIGFIMATAQLIAAQPPRYRATITFQSVKVVDTALPGEHPDMEFNFKVGSQSFRLPINDMPLNANARLNGIEGIRLDSEFVGFDGNIQVSVQTNLPIIRDWEKPGDRVGQQEGDTEQSVGANVRNLEVRTNYSPFSDKWGKTITLKSNENFGYFEITYSLQLEQLSSPTTMPLVVSTDLETFSSESAEEYGGDEPYLFGAVIYIDEASVAEGMLDILADPEGETDKRLFDVSFIKGIHGNLGHLGVDAGDSFTIPAITEFGTKHFYLQQFGETPKEDTKALVVLVALEQDETLTSSIAAGNRKFVEEVQKEAQSIVRIELLKRLRSSLLPENPPSLEEQIAAAAERIKKAVRDRVEEAERASRNDAYLFCCVDNDDVIGYASTVITYDQLEQAGNTGVPFQMNFENTFLVNNIGTVSWKTVKYSVSGTMRGVPFAPPKKVSVLPNLFISKP